MAFATIRATAFMSSVQFLQEHQLLQGNYDGKEVFCLHTVRFPFLTAVFLSVDVYETTFLVLLEFMINGVVPNDVSVLNFCDRGVDYGGRWLRRP